MGRDIDSVIVDSERTAIECIEWLKTNRKAPMTFVPVATCKAKAVDEQLRSMGGTARLAIDLVQYDAHLERAFMYCLG